jgi:hypothetical protein
MGRVADMLHYTALAIEAYWFVYLVIIAGIAELGWLAWLSTFETWSMRKGFDRRIDSLREGAKQKALQKEFESAHQE